MAPVEPDSPKGSARRRFVVKLMQVLASLGIFGTVLGLHAKRSAQTLPPQAIRPPGALPEEDFLSACVRCGLCVRDCPYDTLRLAEFGEPVTTGTPFFVARDIPCEMCEDIPCVKACPTGALDHSLVDIARADMGLAVFTGLDTCYSFTGIGQCRACYMACPVVDAAITMEPYSHSGRTLFMPTVHTQHCTGCGKCEKDCITELASIKVMPRHLVRQDVGLTI